MALHGFESYLLLLTYFVAFSYCQDGNWSPWSKLQTPCQKSQEDDSLVHCGGGVRIRYRSCTNPVPADDGKPCEGSDFKVRIHF